MARRSALSLQNQGQNLIVVEDFQFEAPKTKSFLNVLSSLGIADQKSLFVMTAANNNVYLSSRNVTNTKVVTADEINTYKLLNASKVVLFEGAVSGIETNLSK